MAPHTGPMVREYRVPIKALILHPAEISHATQKTSENGWRDPQRNQHTNYVRRSITQTPAAPSLNQPSRSAHDGNPPAIPRPPPSNQRRSQRISRLIGRRAVRLSSPALSCTCSTDGLVASRPWR